MSTPQTQSDRTAPEQPTPTLTDGRWRAPTTATTGETARTPDATPSGRVQSQFATDCESRLPNLIDEENRATL